MHKYKCSCGVVWLSSDEPVVVKCYEDVGSPQERHNVREIKGMTSSDFAEIWASDLEDENRHSLTDMPGAILNILEKEIQDKTVVRRIMKKLYEIGIGLE